MWPSSLTFSPSVSLSWVGVLLGAMRTDLDGLLMMLSVLSRNGLTGSITVGYWSRLATSPGGVGNGVFSPTGRVDHGPSTLANRMKYPFWCIDAALGSGTTILLFHIGKDLRW